MTQRDDLVSELRQQARNRTESIGPDAHIATAEWRAATALEAKDAEIARLKACWQQQNELLASQAQQITDGRTIYDAAHARIAELERQLAEKEK